MVNLRGQLDLDSAPALTDALDGLYRDGVNRIVVDLSGVSFCDSTGLSSLVVGYHRANRAGCRRSFSREGWRAAARSTR